MVRIWLSKLLGELRGVAPAQRTARFVSVVCCVFPDGKSLTVRGVGEGRITEAPAGQDGFGYDPVFAVGERTFAQLTAAEKDAVSHRGRALRALAEALPPYLEGRDPHGTDADQ